MFGVIVLGRKTTERIPSRKCQMIQTNVDQKGIGGGGVGSCWIIDEMSDCRARRKQERKIISDTTASVSAWNLILPLVWNTKSEACRIHRSLQHCCGSPAGRTDQDVSSDAPSQSNCFHVQSSLGKNPRCLFLMHRLIPTETSHTCSDLDNIV